MAYQTQTFTDNETVLTAAMMDHIEAGIVANETSIEDVSTDLASHYVQKNVIAASFDETTPYTKGQYVWCENVLCRFLVDHEPGAFVDEEVEYVPEDGLSGEVASAVRYDAAQTLTDTQKAQARENIDAVGTDEMSEEYLCQMLFGNEDDWSVANYNSMSYSATKTGRIITYKGNNTSNSGFQSVNLTGVPGAPHTARSGNFSVIELADTDFVPIPAILKAISKQSATYPVMLFLSGYMHYDRYNDDGHAGFTFDYVLRRYNTETETYEYTTRTTTNLGLINTPTTADGVDRISIAQLIPDGRGGDYVVNWDEWEEMAIFAMRRNRMLSGTMLLTPSLEIYGDQKPVVYSAEQTLTDAQKTQARENIGTAGAEELDTLGVVRTLNLAWVQGAIGGSGTNTSSTTRIRTNTYYRMDEDTVVIYTVASGYEILARAYTTNDPSGHIGIVPNWSLWSGNGLRYVVPAGCYLRFMVRKTDDSVIVPADGDNVTVTLLTGGAGNLAPSDTETASNTYAAGDMLTVGGQLYKATQAIATGETIAAGTNVTETSVAEQLAEQGTAIAAIKTDVENIFMEPWQLVAKKYFLPDSTGNLTVRRNHITYRPSASQSSPAVRSLIGAYEGANTTLGNYTPTIDQLIPVSVFGDAIKIGFYLDAAGTDRYPRFAYKFCTVDGETVTPISGAQGSIPATAATDVLAETTAAVPDGATHVFFGLLYSNGYTENATYDMVYKVDKG